MAVVIYIINKFTSTSIVKIIQVYNALSHDYFNIPIELHINPEAQLPIIVQFGEL